MIKAAMLLFTFSFAIVTVFAQVPQAINYQAIARDAGGNVMSNQTIGIKVAIHQTSSSGSVAYSETFSPTTNQFGLFTVAIGQGTPLGAAFSSINWSAGNFWLQVLLSPSNNSVYTDMGASQLLSVPYAMYAANAGNPGITGATGATGLQGIQGTTGVTGATGSTGADGALNAWSLKGNSGNSGVTNFIGNTDNVDLVFKTNNSERARITSGGNIGLCTTTPNALLDVSPTGSNYMIPGGSTGYLFKVAGNGYDPGSSPITVYGIYSYPTTSGIGSGTVYSAAFLGGNVGIGTATPSTLFSVGANNQFNVTSSGNVGLFTTTPDQNALLDASPKTSSFMIPGGSTGYLIKAAGNGYDPGTNPITLYGVYSNPTTSGIGTGTVYSAAFLGGNVGIGTATPSTLFSVGANNQFNVTSSGNVGLFTTTPDQNALLDASPKTSSFMIPGGSTGYLIKAAGNGYDPGTNPITLYGVYSNPTTSGIGTGTVYSAAFLGGNVGIGTATPASTLSVGTSNQFQVNSTGNITQINNVATSFPSTQGAANTYLQNDGSGNLSWNTPTPIATTYSSASLTLSSTWVNDYSANISIYAPCAGSIVVEATVKVILEHTTGNLSRLCLAIGSSPSDQGDIYNNLWWDIPSGMPTFGQGYYTFNVRKVFTVSSAGLNTYYLNAVMPFGSTVNTQIYSCVTTAEFH